MGNWAQRYLARHPGLRVFGTKVYKDNVGFLASALAWSLLTSTIPIVIGLVAIAGFFLRSSSMRSELEQHLSAALQGAFPPSEIHDMVRISVEHRGLLGIIGFLGLLWGGSNVGGAMSTVFQPIFQVRGRNFLREKVIDVAMILVFTVLLVVILGATAAGALVDRLVRGQPESGLTPYLIGTAIALVAAFVLFAVVYVVFPNVQPRFKFRHVWPGAATAAILFEVLTYVWPLYAHLSVRRYGAILLPILILTAWLYFLAVIVLIGAELVSFRTLGDARAHNVDPGPPPDGMVPQREDRGKYGTAS